MPFPPRSPRPQPPWRQGLRCLDSGVAAGRREVYEGQHVGCLPCSGSPSLTPSRSRQSWQLAARSTPQMAVPTACFAGLGPQHRSLQQPWTLFCPLLSSSFRLCHSGTAVQRGRAGEGRRKKWGGCCTEKRKKSEKAVIWGLGTLVVSLLPLPDPPFQTRMRRLLRNGPGPALSSSA